MNTFALFLVDSDLQAVRCIDSERMVPPPADRAYVRFLNGISDAGPLYLELDGNSMSNSIFHDTTGQPIPIGFASPNKYELIKAGTRQTYVQVSDPNNPKPQFLFQQPLTFKGGHYYTIRATGNVADQSQQLTSDDEE